MLDSPRLARILTIATLALASFAPDAAAQIAYVDAVNGNDSNSGSSPSSAFRTLTRASQPPAFQRVLVMPGRYDAALGEVFPINIPVDSRWIADAAVVDPGSTNDAFVLPLGVWEPTSLVGFRIENAARGVVAPTFTAGITDCTFDRCGVGVDVVSPQTHAFLQVRILDCVLRNCDVGIRSRGRENLRVSSANVQGSRIGIDLDPGIGGTDTVDADISRSATAVRVRSGQVSGADSAVIFVIGLVHRCSVGIDVDAGTAGLLELGVERATLVNCRVALNVQGTLNPDSLIRELILDGNLVDAPLGLGGITLSDSIVTSGSLTGPNVINADPMFVDPAIGDYSLQWRSPAIDAGSQLGLDGNLDTNSTSDFGAFEFLTLTGPAEAPTSSSPTYEVRGNPGSTVLVVFNSTPNSSGFPLTPFGSLTVGIFGAERGMMVQIPPGATQTTFQVPIPSTAFVGARWQVQALVQSSASATGWAFSNSVQTRVR